MFHFYFVLLFLVLFLRHCILEKSGWGSIHTRTPFSMPLHFRSLSAYSKASPFVCMYVS
jgi:hypothetical protein